MARSGAIVSITATGQVSGASDGVFLGQPGYIPAIFGGAINGTVFNQGQITASGSGNLSNGVVLNVASSFVNNSGTITGKDATGKAGLGIALIYGGGLLNTGMIAGGFAGFSAGGNPVTKGSTNIINTGSISGSKLGVRLWAGGSIQNSGLITGTGYNGLGAPKYNSGGIRLVNGGTVTNSGTVYGTQQALYGAKGITVTNSGKITGGAPFISEGIQLIGGGAVTNVAGATISAGGYAVYSLLPGATTVVNAGTIQVTSQAKASSGVKLDTGRSDSITNQSGGTITGDYAAWLRMGGTLTNYGVIAGAGTGHAVGFILTRGGAINNAQGATISGVERGAYLYYALRMPNGATFAASSLTVGAQSDASGAVVVSGVGSVVQLSGALNIGTALGIADLTVGPGAPVHASVVNLQGPVALEGGLLDPTVQLINQGQTAGGFGTIAAGDIVDEGVIQAGGNKASQKLLLVVGNVLGGGTLIANGAQPGSNPAGVLLINSGGTLELTGAVLNAATTTFTDNLTPTGTYTVNNSVVDVTFADAAGVLKLDDIAGFAGTITTHQAGDSFVITGGTLSNPNVVNGNTLTFADSGAGAGAGGIDQIIFASQISAAGFSIVNNNTVQIACFAAGTRIETATGLVAVEALSVGQYVFTNDGRREPIVWLGQRSVHCDRHQKPETVWPVRVRTGAFGENVPLRDLYLSPDHAVFVNRVLVPVKLLINGASIAQIKVHRVVYHHVELRRHDVIFAEGLPTESYLDAGDRNTFSRGPVTALYPDFVARRWEMAGCAPLVLTGAALEAVRSVLADRAQPASRTAASS